MKSLASKSLNSLRSWRATLGVKATLTVGLAIGGSIIARLIYPVIQILLARLMGFSQYGLYIALFALLSPVASAASLGLEPWLLRQSGKPGLAGSIGDVLAVRLGALSLLVLVAAPLLALTHRDSYSLAIVSVAGVALVSETLVATADAALRAQARVVAAALLQVGIAAVFFGLVWFAWRPGASMGRALAYRTGASLIGLGSAWWLLRAVRPAAWAPRRWWAMLKQTKVYYASEILATISLKADLTMIALLAGSAAVALYGPGLTIINTTFLVPGIASQIILPLISRQRFGSPKYWITLQLGVVCSVAYGLLVAAALFWAAPLVVSILYGPEYSGTVPLLQIMCLIPLLKSLNFCWATIMVAHDQQPLRTKLQAVGALFNPLANLAWIPLFGVMGAAWVNLATEFILVLCYGYGAWVTVRREQHTA
ncbi:MAG TPA: polysaccharide biosynthesis C-terminal domain-containing protein [Herpetosiphonaceae bacterium]